MTTFITQSELHDKILLAMSWSAVMTSWSLFWNIFILRSLGEAYFPDIIKVITIFIKKIFEDSKKVKRIRNYVAKSNISVFSDIANADFWQKSPGFSTAQGVFHVIHMFLGVLQVRYFCAKFHHCRICVTDFRERSIFAPPPLLSSSMSSLEKAYPEEG